MFNVKHARMRLQPVEPTLGLTTECGIRESAASLVGLVPRIQLHRRGPAIPTFLYAQRPP